MTKHVDLEVKHLGEIVERLYHGDHVEISSRIDPEHGRQHVVFVRYLEQGFDFGATARFDPELVAYWVKPGGNGGYEIRINVGFFP